MLEDEALEARVARGREEVEEAEALAQAAGSEGASLVDERAAVAAREQRELAAHRERRREQAQRQRRESEGFVHQRDLNV